MQRPRPRPRPDVADGEGTASTPEPFDDVYAAHYRRLVVLAYATTGDVGIAEDIVQDAFLQLHRQWDQVEAPVAWLRRTVSNLSISWLRRTIVGRRVADRVATQDTAAAPPADSVELRAMLAPLSSKERAVVALRFYEDLTGEEIARILQLRPGTVRSLLSRALTTMRKEFTDAHRS